MIVTKRKLKTDFGPWAWAVLGEYLKSLPRKRGEQQKYEVVKLLPPREEYNRLCIERFTTTVRGLVEDAFGVFADLAQELCDWRENLPESIQDSDKGQALEETQDALENLSEPDLDEPLASIPVYYMPPEEVTSRAARLSNAIDMLQTCVNELNEMENHPNKDDIDVLVGELDNIVSEAEGIEIPGVYG